VDQPIHVRASKDVGQSHRAEQAVARRDHRELTRPSKEGQGPRRDQGATRDRRGGNPLDLRTVRSPRLRRGHDQDGDSEKKEERMGRSSRGEEEPRGHRAASGGHGQGGGCRQEQRREGQVGQVPRGQVHGEGPGQHAGQHPGRSVLTVVDIDARRTLARYDGTLMDERRRAQAHGRSQHALQRRENGSEREMQRTL